MQFHWDRSGSADRKQIGMPKYEDMNVTQPAERKSGSIVVMSDPDADLTVAADGDTISGTIALVTTDGKTITLKEFSPAEEQLKGNPRH